MTHFPPSPSILTSVVMTRAAFAQLQGQVFHPPRVFGAEWHVRDGSAEGERRWRDLGVKVAVGFEIMYREGGSKGRSGTVRPYLFTKADEQIADSADEIRKSQEYRIFLSGLTKAGFFGDEIEGSERWKARELEAFQGWQCVRADELVYQAV